MGLQGVGDTAPVNDSIVQEVFAHGAVVPARAGVAQLPEGSCCLLVDVAQVAQLLGRALLEVVERG